MQRHEPIFNVPPAVLACLAVLAAVHAVLSLLPVESEQWWTIALAFVPARYAGYSDDIPGGAPAMVTSFVTHMLVHGDVTHLMFNSAWLLAFGGAIAQRLGSLRFIAFSLLCGIAGAATFLVFNMGLPASMVGASGAISGLMGGVFRFLFNVRGTGGLWQLRHAPRSIPAMPLAQALGDRRVLTAIAIWFGVNFLALFGIGGPQASGGIAWEAHIGGFVAGLLIFGAFEPPLNDNQPAPTRVQGPER